MNLKVSRRKTGRTYLSIVKNYRDKKTGQSRTSTIKSLGYVDELEKEYDDPVAHFREVARLMTEEEQAKKKLTLKINMDEELELSAEGRKNFGYAAILKIYHELGLHRFFTNRARSEGFKFNTNAIMILLLVISRFYRLVPRKRLLKKKAVTSKGLIFN
jgi:hypothetical protein